MNFAMVKFEQEPVLLSGTEYHQIVSLSTLRLCHQELLKSQASPDLLVQYGGGRSLHHLLISFHFISCLRHEHREQLIWRAEFSGAVDGSAQPASCNVLWHCKGCQTILPRPPPTTSPTRLDLQCQQLTHQHTEKLCSDPGDYKQGRTRDNG